MFAAVAAVVVVVVVVNCQSLGCVGEWRWQRKRWS